MNIDDPHGPVGIDEPEQHGGGGRGVPRGAELERLRGEVFRLEEQLARKTKDAQFLQQQVDRMVQAAATSRQEEQNRRQEILRELSTEKTRRQEAETEASAQRHRATELTFLVDALEAEVEALTGRTRGERGERGDHPRHAAPTVHMKSELPPSSHVETPEVTELQTEVALLREQVIIHRDDFNRENTEKEKLLRLTKQLQEELDRVGLEVIATKARVGKLENENDILLSDNRLFKDKFSKGKDRDTTRHNPDIYQDLLLEKLGPRPSVVEQQSYMKDPPPPVSLHPKPTHQHHSGHFNKQDFDMTSREYGMTSREYGVTSREWTCTRCTLVNTASREFCDVCGHRRKELHHVVRQQSAPVSGWTECDTYIDTSYR